ncbi:MAG: hypothetical protein LQ350_000083 [Teloschistes chrysophthalmus]|nr:MAG: hypothetical protein LQ350_000083 [Niorma chrysophthalma]
MPGKELVASQGPAISPDLSMLKRHKTLPKRRAISSDVGQAPAALVRERYYDLDREGYSSSERIRSWIPEPSSIQAVPDNGFPLTPPLNTSEAINGQAYTGRTSSYRDTNGTSIHTASSGIATPVLQRSPPTPETTPPKLDLPTNVSHESSASYLLSTRAESSFETAHEKQTPNEQPDQAMPQSVHLSSRPQANHVGKPPKHIGLGLGMEMDDGYITPTEDEVHSTLQGEELVSFDGAWNGATPEMEAVRGGANLTYRAGLKKCLPKRPRISDQLLETPLIVDNSTPSPVPRSVSLKPWVNENQPTPPRTSADGFSNEIQWPLQDDGWNLEEKLREVDDKRFSQVSATSTIIEAMVFTTPPRRRKTLRHSSKCADLTSSSKSANRASLSLDNHGQRRLSRQLKSPNGGQRASFVDGHENLLLSESQQDTIPVIVTPRTNYYSEPKQHSRPTTAPNGAIGYFDPPRAQRRIVSASESRPVAYEQKRHVRRTQNVNVQPDLPLSAQLSRNVSGATSGSGSLGLDPTSPSKRQQSETLHHPYGFPNTGISPDEESNGDWSALRPRSSLVTPFSLRSARSSTPGTLEVNEATAISIYPHTNKSILVVQHAPGRNSQEAEHSAIIASNAKFAIPAGSVKPPVINQPRELLDSPLQNPRSPPQPPDFKIVPPTPANATDVSSPDRHERPPSEHPPKRRLSTSIRRAFSTRRYSEAFVAPLARSLSLSRRNTVAGGSHNRRASTGIDLDRGRNLHPSWRPRSFWDARDGSGSDSDSDFGNDGYLVGNSLNMSTEGVKTFEQPPPPPPKRMGSLSRRLGSLRIPKRRNSIAVTPDNNNNNVLRDEYYDHHPADFQRTTPKRIPSLRHKTATFYRRSSRVDNNNNNASYEFIQRSPPPLDPQQQQQYPQDRQVADANGVPRLGYQVQFVGFKGVVEKVKEKREEARREKVRERLRGSIDVLRGV